MLEKTKGGIREQEIHAIAEELEETLRPLAGTTILVAGGSGFIGSYFLETLAWLNDTAWERSCRMLCVDNLRSGDAQRLTGLLPREDFVLLQHDLTSPLPLEESVAWIIHGASIASPPFYRRYPKETLETNVLGTRHLLAVARERQVRSFLYLSSSEIYGDPPAEEIPTAETYRGNVSCTGPRACYDESKRLAETLCTVAHRMEGVPVKIVRPFNVYGPGQRLDDRRVIPDLMAAAVKRQPLTLYSPGQDTRAFCYVSDAIRAMWLVLMGGEDGGVYNVGNDEEEITIQQLAERVREVAGPPWLEILRETSPDPEYLTDNPKRRCPHLVKIRSAFPWEPRVSLTEGLRRTLASYSGDTQLNSRGRSTELSNMSPDP